MHVKLNVIKLFNRLSLSANQNSYSSSPTTTTTTTSSTPSDVETTVKVNNIRNSLFDMASKTDELDSECKKINGDVMASTKNKINNNQKFIVSSNYQLHEDDLSRIDVKSLVRSQTKIFNE